MLREFRVIDEKGPAAVEDICDLFTDDCVLEDTGSKAFVRGRDGLHAYCTELLRVFPVRTCSNRGWTRRCARGTLGPGDTTRVGAP